MKCYRFQEDHALVGFAHQIARSLKPGDRLYLTGDLGAGKTTLVRHILQALGVTGNIKSPTYTLAESYEVTGDQGGLWTLHHFDLYRLTDPEALYFLGLDNYFTPETLCLIEWPEKGLGVLPRATKEIVIRPDLEGRAYQVLKADGFDLI